MAFESLKGWSSAQKHVVAASYLGWTLDAFDYLLLTYVAKDIAAEFHTDAKAIGLAAFLTLGLRPLGAFIFGRMADRFQQHLFRDVRGPFRAPDLRRHRLLRRATR